MDSICDGHVDCNDLLSSITGSSTLSLSLSLSLSSHVCIFVFGHGSIYALCFHIHYDMFVGSVLSPISCSSKSAM